MEAVVEIKTLEEILLHTKQYNPEKVMLVCDIDNTLLKSKGHFGGTAWSDYMEKKLRECGIDTQGLVELELWSSIIPHVVVEHVDPKTSEIISFLQKQGVHVYALTARSRLEKECTHRQLLSINVDLSVQDKVIEGVPFERGLVCYEKGVLFAAADKKSEVLLDFLNKIDLAPELVIFVDDKQFHVEDVVTACEETGLECVGLRFSGADHHVRLYDPIAAEEEWGKIEDPKVKEIKSIVSSILYGS